MNLNNPAVKTTVQLVGFVSLFIVSFIFFLYLTFPYEVLKETIAAEVSSASGYSIQIGELGPKFPLGVDAKALRIEAASGTSAITLDRVKVGVGILPLLLGRLGLTARAEKAGGSLEVGLNFGLLSLIKGAPMPRHVGLEVVAFPIDEFTRFGLASASGGGNPMLTSMLTTIGLNGKLNGLAEFALDTSDPTQSKGQTDLKINGAALTFSDPSIGLPDQIFSKAQLKAKVDGGTLVVDNTSGFVSEELEIGIEGKIALKQELTASPLNMKASFKLNAGLKEKFGFLIDAVLSRTAGDGQVTMQILGTLGEPSTSSF